MIEIVGEKIIAFCNGKSIILNNFDNTDKYRRSKRSTDNKKRYHGQTQTQFISFGSKNSDQETKNGLAEALSQPDLTRATVSEYLYIIPMCILFDLLKSIFWVLSR